MATFKICIFRHQKRKDGKFPVSIRVCWQREYGYIKTEFYVTGKQIKDTKKEFSVKDAFIIRELNDRIATFEEVKSKKLGFKINLYTAKELADYFEKELNPGSDSAIDFVEFSKIHCKRLREQDRESTAKIFERTVNAMIDFCKGREKIFVSEITYKFLKQFEVFLRSERTIKRPNQFGKIITTKRKGLSDVSVFNYMTDVRTLFNAAIEEYNDEDKMETRITHYPFKKYKLKKPPEAEKRNLKPEQLLKVFFVSDEDLALKRSILARDVFILSFYLVGMNTIDLYGLKASEYANGRFTYKRKKTRRRRTDEALISIKVEPEIIPLIEKYKDKSGKYCFDFNSRYADSHIFVSNINKGLKKVADKCNINEELSTYYARHSWATIARNKCRISKSDVDECLNHVDQGSKMADYYIEKDWTLIDESNRKVLDFLKEVEKQS